MAATGEEADARAACVIEVRWHVLWGLHRHAFAKRLGTYEILNLAPINRFCLAGHHACLHVNVYFTVLYWIQGGHVLQPQPT